MSSTYPTLTGKIPKLRTGDIVELDNVELNKKKYYLCLHGCIPPKTAKFLYLNSEDEFRDNYAFTNAQVPCLPISKTGLTVVSASIIVQFTAAELISQKAFSRGRLDPALARVLEPFVETKVTSLKADQRAYVLKALSLIV